VQTLRCQTIWRNDLASLGVAITSNQYTAQSEQFGVMDMGFPDEGSKPRGTGVSHQDRPVRRPVRATLSAPAPVTTAASSNQEK
jgi:hypothetical protein